MFVACRFLIHHTYTWYVTVDVKVDCLVPRRPQTVLICLFSMLVFLWWWSHILYLQWQDSSCPCRNWKNCSNATRGNWIFCVDMENAKLNLLKVSRSICVVPGCWLQAVCPKFSLQLCCAVLQSVFFVNKHLSVNFFYLFPSLWRWVGYIVLYINKLGSLLCCIHVVKSLNQLDPSLSTSLLLYIMPS